MTSIHSGASELSQLMEGTTAGALIPEIVRRGFQDLLEAKVFLPLEPVAMNAALSSAPPTATATASGCSLPRWASSAWPSHRRKASP